MEAARADFSNLSDILEISERIGGRPIRKPQIKKDFKGRPPDDVLTSRTRLVILTPFLRYWVLCYGLNEPILDPTQNSHHFCKLYWCWCIYQYHHQILLKDFGQSRIKAKVYKRSWSWYRGKVGRCSVLNSRWEQCSMWGQRWDKTGPSKNSEFWIMMENTL